MVVTSLADCDTAELLDGKNCNGAGRVGGVYSWHFMAVVYFSISNHVSGGLDDCQQLCFRGIIIWGLAGLCGGVSRHRSSFSCLSYGEELFFQPLVPLSSSDGKRL